MSNIINPMPELESLLKQLRLSGMLETLALHNKQAIEGQLTYPEFLALILQDELLRRDRKKFDTRIKKGRFNPNKTIENFDFLFNPKINKAQILDIASCRFVQEKSCVLLMGPCGTGKSHIAQAIGNCATRLNIDVLFIDITELLTSLQTAKAMGCYEKRKNALAKIPLLIIDDFGLKPLRTPQDEDFHDLLIARHERASTLITSNLAYEEWIHSFPNKLLGVAVLDRLRDRGYGVVLEGKSYRTFKNVTPKSTKKTPLKVDKNAGE